MNDSYNNNTNENNNDENGVTFNINNTDSYMEYSGNNNGNG